MITPSTETPDPKSDIDLIDVYLNLPTVEVILAQLAPAQTMEEALDRPANAKQTLSSRRAFLARELSSDGLFSLLDQLANIHGIGNWMDGNPLSEFSDAHPAIAEFEQRTEQGLALDDMTEKVRSDTYLAQAKGMLGPGWREGPVDAREWMGIIIGKPQDFRYAYKVLRAWEDHLRGTRFLNETPKLSPMDAGFSKEIQAEREGVRKFIVEFWIGKIPSAGVAAILAKLPSEDWPPSKKFETDLGKARSVLVWHRFWTEYGGENLAGREGKRRRRKDSKKQSGGQARANQRQRDRWVRFTQNFVEWAGTSVVDYGLIDDFGKQPDVDLRKGRAFLKTLLNARNNTPLQAEFIENLESEGINLPEHTGEAIASECFSILVHRAIPQK